MITPKLLLRNADQYSQEAPFSFKDSNNQWHTDNWVEFRDHTFQIAKSIIALGISFDDKISPMAFLAGSSLLIKNVISIGSF